MEGNMQTVIQQFPALLQVTLAVVPTVSALAAALGLWLNVRQSRKTTTQDRAALVASFLREFASDKEMSQIFYAIEYSKFRYDAKFHESTQERQLDKLLVHFSNLALAWQAGLLEDTDIQPVQYFARVLFRNEEVRKYLDFVGEWTDQAKLGEHPYIALARMGKALGAE